MTLIKEGLQNTKDQKVLQKYIGMLRYSARCELLSWTEVPVRCFYRYHFTSVLRPKTSVLGFLMAEVLVRRGSKAFREAHEICNAWRVGRISYGDALSALKAMLS